MKKIILILATWVFSIGETKAQEINFESIKMSGVLNVTLVQGDKCDVRVENDNEKSITYNIMDGELTIEGKGRKSGNDAPAVFVTVKNLKSINAVGVVNLNSTSEINATDIKINIEGVVSADLAVKADKISIEQESVGSFNLKGSARELLVDLEGVGSFSSKELIASDVKVSAEGIGSVQVYAKDKLVVSNEGIGSVEYFGNPPIVQRGSEDLFDNNSHSKMKRDTTRIRLGQRKIIVFKDTTGYSIKKNLKKNTPRPWKGMGVSMNGYVNQDYSTQMVHGFEFMELNPTKSIGYHWNFWEKDINLYKKQVRLITGLGFEWNRYAFRHDILYNASKTPTSYHVWDGDSIPYYGSTYYVSGKYDSIPHKSTKLKTSYFTFPLILQYNFNSNSNKPVGLSAGVIGGVLMGITNRVKYESGRLSSSSSSSDYDQMLPFKCDATVRLSKGRYTLFGNYRLTKMYRTQRGPLLHPFSVGFNYRIFK